MCEKYSLSIAKCENLKVLNTTKKLSTASATNISYGPAKSFVFECKQSVELGDQLTLAKPCLHSAFLFFCFIGLKYKFSRHTSTNVNSQRKIENIKEIP